MNTVFDVLDLIKKYGGKKPMESDFNDQCSLLATGKAAIIHQGNWAEDTVRKTTPDIDIGYLLGPVGDTPDRPGSCSTPTRPSALPRAARTCRRHWRGCAGLPPPRTARAGSRTRSSSSPDHRSKGLQRTARPATVSLLAAKTPNYSWYYQRFPTGTEQSLGIILQGYCAGQTNRQQTLDSLDAAYTKIVNASK